MEAFISRKKRKLSLSHEVATNSPATPPSDKQPDFDLATPDDSEIESTDFKLALLSSLYSEIEQQLLLDVLLEHEGSVLDASEALSSAISDSPPTTTTTITNANSNSNAAATGYQSSLSSFVTQTNLLTPSSPSNATPKPKLLCKRGQTLHLYSPADVEAHTPCTIIHNFLPADEANALLLELLGEAQSFERSTFKLFDNVVQSPHTSAFFVESLEEVRVMKTEYIYNGGRLDVSYTFLFLAMYALIGLIIDLLAHPACHNKHSSVFSAFSSCHCLLLSSSTHDN